MGETTCFRCGITTARQDDDALDRVCDRCLVELISTRADELADLLESHKLPAALISRDLTVLAFNSRFEQLFQSDHGIGGMRVGEVLD